jgi:hypothetical protein
MPTMTFSYSKFWIWHVAAFIIIVFTFTTVMVVTDPTLLIVFAIIGCMAVYFIINFIKNALLPALSGKKALVMDDKTLFVQSSNTTVYWHDISEISWYTFNKTRYILLQMKHGKPDVKIKTEFLEADDDMIYKTLQGCFKQSSLTN